MPDVAANYPPGSRTDDAPAAVAWRDGAVVLLDQTRLPTEETELVVTDVAALVAAIRRLVVRGAPALGIVGAYGVALAAQEARRSGVPLAELAEQVAAARPTAVNLRWGVQQALVAAMAADGDPAAAARAVGDEIARVDAESSERMAELGVEWVPDGARVLTHCNTGRLVSGGGGTAFAVIAAAHRLGRVRHLWVDETRPLLQGARLTAWEAARAGLPHSVLADAAAGSLFARGEVDVVLVGADRVCADGSVANKIGTFPLAVLAHHHGVPFVVVAPTSTVDLTTATGADVEVEQRPPDEVTHYAGRRVAPAGSTAYNPGFDVTPAALVSALVTERGVLAPPTAAGLAAIVGGSVT